MEETNNLSFPLSSGSTVPSIGHLQNMPHHSEVMVDDDDVTDVSIIAGHVDHCEMQLKKTVFKGEQTISSLRCLFISS